MPPLPDPQRRLVCLSARERIRVKRDADRARERDPAWFPTAEWLALEAGTRLGVEAAMRELSPGRWQHCKTLAKRIARRFGGRR